MTEKPQLSLDRLRVEAANFARLLSDSAIGELYGVTDGKAVGTYVEAAFHTHIGSQFDTYVPGSAARGIDFPSLDVDLKVTSVKQPQSSCPFRDATQKVYGLGYHLLVFVYEKTDDAGAETARLQIRHAIFVDRTVTGDFQTTSGLREIIERNGNLDDVEAFLEERRLPLDEVGRRRLAERILDEPPQVGCLTISNALQWRLQYGRAIAFATEGREDGPENLLAE